jgi:hypothetical protein
LCDSAQNHFNSTKWNRVDTRGSVRTNTSFNGTKSLYLRNTGANNYVVGLMTNLSYYNITSNPPTNIVLETRMRSEVFPVGCNATDVSYPACSPYSVGYGVQESPDYDGSRNAEGFEWYDMYSPHGRLKSNGVRNSTNALFVNDQTWHDVKINYIGTVNNGTIELYVDGNLKMVDGRFSSAQPRFEISLVSPKGGGEEAVTYFDYVLVREYSSTEPSYTLESTEEKCESGEEIYNLTSNSTLSCFNSTNLRRTWVYNDTWGCGLSVINYTYETPLAYTLTDSFDDCFGEDVIRHNFVYNDTSSCDYSIFNNSYTDCPEFNRCIDGGICELRPIVRDLTNVGQGTGALFEGMGLPLVGFLILISVGIMVGAVIVMASQVAKSGA